MNIARSIAINYFSGSGRTDGEKLMTASLQTNEVLELRQLQSTEPITITPNTHNIRRDLVLNIANRRRRLNIPNSTNVAHIHACDTDPMSGNSLTMTGILNLILLVLFCSLRKPLVGLQREIAEWNTIEFQKESCMTFLQHLLVGFYSLEFRARFLVPTGSRKSKAIGRVCKIVS